jgi:hypothetical protein
MAQTSRADIAALRQDMKEGFEKVDARFDKVDARFNQMDDRLRNLEMDVGEIRGFVFSGGQLLPERHSNNLRRKRAAEEEKEPKYAEA